MPSETEVLTSIQIRYGRLLTQEEINYLKQEILIDHGRDSTLLTEVMAKEMTPQEAVSKLQQVFMSNTPKTKSNSDNKDGALNRSFVNSQMIVLNAQKRDEVMTFRKDVLRNKLLPTDKLHLWIRRRTKAKSGYELFYWLPDKDITTSIYITPEGILEQLRVLSIKVSIAFGWTEAQSTTWVMTGVFPIIEAIEVGAQIFPLEPIANKIILKIDPTSTDEEIKDAYKWARDRYFTPRGKRNTRKNECLALHFKKTEGMKRHERLREWNKFCNDQGNSWGYDPNTGANNFGRDLKYAYQSYLEGRALKRGVL